VSASRPDRGVEAPDRRQGYAATVRARVAVSVEVKQSLLADGAAHAVLGVVAAVLVDCLRGGGTVFFCGNGGSSTDCEHLSAELLGRFYRDRPALPAVNLSCEQVFSRQLEGLGRAGDVLVALSTSGDSVNVLAAVRTAAARGMTTVAFTGRGGGALAEVADHVFRAPTVDTPRIQECHTLAGHTLCEIVEDELWSS